MAMFLTGLCGIADGVLQYVGKGNKTLEPVHEISNNVAF